MFPGIRHVRSLIDYIVPLIVEFHPRHLSVAIHVPLPPLHVLDLILASKLVLLPSGFLLAVKGLPQINELRK